MSKNLLLILGVLLLVAGFAFYWFEYRPSEIRKMCWRIAPSTIEGNTAKNYQACLIDHGIEK